MSTPTVIATGTYTLDTTRSTISVSHKAMWGLATVQGTFVAQSGGAEVHDDESASGTVTIGAASLDTANAKRDEHLRSDRFFDTAHHPTISVAVRGATLGADGKTVSIDAQLTIRGVTRPQTLTATITETTPDAVTLSTRFEVDRTAYGLSWNWAGMLRGPAVLTATLRFTRS
ncbi:YceI family protein [Streptomyces sp. NPDC002677]|uniref:YceI family protein n=1 Tax=Streptomyces sp. NPDC002677 TaxID=3154774 RepID=UPI0033190F98